MGSSESRRPILARVAGAVLRAACIVAGTWLFAGVLVDRWLEPAGRSLDGGTLDALIPGPAVREAAGHSILLGAAGCFFGAVIAGLVVLGGRVPRLASILWPLTAPTLALAVPGLLLLPVVDAVADRWGLAPMGPVVLADSLGDTARFLTLWGLAIGLAVAPGLAVLFQPTAGERRLGHGVAGATLAARTESVRRWRVGFPATALALGVASAELLSDQPGLFTLFRLALDAEAGATALETIVAVAILGALLALVVELIGIVGGGETDGPTAARSTRPSAALLPVALFGVAVAAVAAVGWTIGDLGVDPTRGLRSPSASGPLLGTDGIGRNNLSATVAAVGPTILHAMLPALVAALGGTALAVAGRSAGDRRSRLIGAITDLLWWPLVLVLPLAYLAFDTPARPELHPGLICVAGLALMPMAARLIGRSAIDAEDGRGARLLASWLSVSTVALAAGLVTSWFGINGAANRPLLGDLLAAGATDYRVSPWPFLVAGVTTAFVLTVLHLGAAALAVPDSPIVPVSASWRSETDPDLAERMLAASAAERVPLSVQLSVPVSEPVSTVSGSRAAPVPHRVMPVPRTEREPAVPSPEAVATNGSGAAGAAATGSGDDGSGADGDPAPIEGRPAVSLERATDDIAIDAARTIELRPIRDQIQAAFGDGVDPTDGQNGDRPGVGPRGIQLPTIDQARATIKLKPIRVDDPPPEV